MSTSSLLIKSAALLALGAALAAGGYVAGSRHAAAPAAAPATGTAATAAPAGDKIDPKTGRKVLYWHDPMVPGPRFDQPGRSPFMDMDLVPVYADEAAQDGAVSISPTMQQNLGIRYAAARRESIGSSVEVVGTTQLDESLAEVVQSRVTGYIERLHARAPMQQVRRGDPVATLFVPEWLAPQEEYLALKKAGHAELADAARERMRALSMPESMIARLEQTGQAQRQLTLGSPVSGVVTELPVRDGAMVSPGMTIAKVAGLNRVWLLAEVPEALLANVRPGMKVTAQFPGQPGREYSGKVREILPQVSTDTRTVQARLELDNRDGSLTPGLLMQVKLVEAAPKPRLLVPTEAVLHSGRQTVVLVVGDDKRVRPVTVTTGRELGADTEILDGLKEGQQVVASGQFLVDSEANLKSALSKFAEPGKQAAAPLHRGTGRVEQVGPEAMTLSHEPIPELKWGKMTMDFIKPRPDAFSQFKPGDRIRFSFRETYEGYLLENVEPATEQRP